LFRRLQSIEGHESPPSCVTWMSRLISSILFGRLHDHWLANRWRAWRRSWPSIATAGSSDAVLTHATTYALLAG